MIVLEIFDTVEQKAVYKCKKSNISEIHKCLCDFTEKNNLPSDAPALILKTMSSMEGKDCVIPRVARFIFKITETSENINSTKIKDVVENIKTKLCEKATDYLINNPIEMYKITNNIYVFKTTGRDVVCEYKDNQWHYSLGCQYNITKDVFIDRIYNDGEGDPDKRPHRKQYLEVIDYVENLDMNK